MSEFSKRLSTFSIRSSRRSRSRSISRTPQPTDEYGLNLLSSPPESVPVVADIVFVHGLGGGSFSTWSVNKDPSSFWPKEWLPQDPDFEGIRTFSFGYNADWAKWAKSPLDVHDFGRSLLEDLHNSPEIRGHGTPIVLVGHSMGGLVIKKMCVLSKMDASFAEISGRLHSFYFLGTPHWGSTLASTLSNVLRVSGLGRRAMVSGLQQRSELIRVLNDEFRLYYQGIQLHTFYETQPTPGVGVVVNTESATMGYAEERRQLLNAAHRELARFPSSDDSNYRSLRNRLASTIQEIRQDSLPAIEPSSRSSVGDERLPQHCSPDEQVNRIRAYLRIEQVLEDALSTHNDIRMKSSCSWITRKPSFLQWLGNATPRYFWLKGPPAFGKSTLASYMIEYLKESPVCYHFFKAGERETTSVSGFLRSMAYQMAKADPVIRESLYDLSQKGPPVDTQNYRLIWSKVLQGCVFRQNLSQTHYWVIDAFDEAAEGGPVDDYFSLMLKIEDTVPLKIFITSRPAKELDAPFAVLPTISEQIMAEDTFSDIQLYVTSRSARLPVADGQERENIIKKVVEKAAGNFLWTTLVMRLLEDTFTFEEIHEVLDDIPQEISKLYDQLISKMERSKTRMLAKHIIIWTICGIYPLTVNEMKDAVHLSLGATVARDLKTSISYICGQFLIVDSQSRIRVVHETARAFLTDPGLESEFRVECDEGNRLIAKACLKYLLSDELKYNPRQRGAPTTQTETMSINNYACRQFSEHIAGSSFSEDILGILDEFFKTNVLSWIECLARLQDLDGLARLSRHLDSYFKQTSSHEATSIKTLELWIVDLPNILTRFGMKLLDDPVLIHTQVPQFCPEGSAILRNFGSSGGSMRVVGGNQRDWDNRIFSITYTTNVNSMDARGEHFAVGFSTGEIKVYKASTCEEIAALKDQGPLSELQLGIRGRLLASNGRAGVTLWDIAKGTKLFQFHSEKLVLAIALNEEETHLTIALEDLQISTFEVSTGALESETSWADPYTDHDVRSCPRISFNLPSIHATPTIAKISLKHQAIALICEDSPVAIFSLESQRLIGTCISNGPEFVGTSVKCVAFNPVLPHLVVSYGGGGNDRVVVFDMSTCEPLTSGTVPLNNISISSDGKLLLCDLPTVRIFDLQTLQLVNRVPSIRLKKKGVGFASNNFRVVEVGKWDVTVWSVPALISQGGKIGTESGNTERDSNGLASLCMGNPFSINNLCCCEENSVVFCSRYDGSVDMCDLDDPENTMRSLYKHHEPSEYVCDMDWAAKPRILVSGTKGGCFAVVHLTAGPKDKWVAQLVMKERLRMAYLEEHEMPQSTEIRQTFVHPSGSLILVTTPVSATLWSVEEKRMIKKILRRPHANSRWFHRTHEELVLFDGNSNSVLVFKWEDLTNIGTMDVSPLLFGGCDSTESHLLKIHAHCIMGSAGDLVMTKTWEFRETSTRAVSYTGSISKVLVLDMSLLKPLPPSSEGPNSSLPTVAPQTVGPELPGVKNGNLIMGTANWSNSTHLVFVTSFSWVCSVDLNRPINDNKVRRHFFIPSVWNMRPDVSNMKLCRNGDVVVCAGGDSIIVIKNGLGVENLVP